MRYPSVAGMFYTGEKNKLSEEILKFLSNAEKDLIEKKKNMKQILGCVVPHAGHIYSGSVAAYSYSLLKLVPKTTTFVIIGPNHTGRGKAVGISREDWVTPLGVVRNDRQVGDAIKKNSTIADFDEEAHMFEHSIEVQLPFLQTILSDLKVVEICMGIQSYEAAKDLAQAIFSAMKEIGRIIVVIASSDFTHFESSESARAKDERALHLIEQLRVRDFVNLVEGENMSICGYGPIATAMLFSEKNNGKATILKYANSGDVTGDYSSVVGYGSVVFYK